MNGKKKEINKEDKERRGEKSTAGSGGGAVCRDRDREKITYFEWGGPGGRSLDEPWLP